MLPLEINLRVTYRNSARLDVCFLFKWISESLKAWTGSISFLVAHTGHSPPVRRFRRRFHTVSRVYKVITMLNEEQVHIMPSSGARVFGLSLKKSLVCVCVCVCVGGGGGGGGGLRQFLFSSWKKWKIYHHVVGVLLSSTYMTDLLIANTQKKKAIDASPVYTLILKL